jgi:hypothetical protein
VTVIVLFSAQLSARQFGRHAVLGASGCRGKVAGNRQFH